MNHPQKTLRIPQSFVYYHSVTAKNVSFAPSFRHNTLTIFQALNIERKRRFHALDSFYARQLVARTEVVKPGRRSSVMAR